MKITRENFSLEGDDIIHVNFYYEELYEILIYLKGIEEKEFFAIDLKLSIHSISQWEEENIERNMFLLEKMKILTLTRIDKYPVRSYKAIVASDNISAFQKFQNSFILDKKMSEDECLILINEIEKKVVLEFRNRFLEEANRKVSMRYSKSERKAKLIEERDEQLKEYTQNSNILSYYDISNPQRLAKQIKRGIGYEKMPIVPNNFFSCFVSPIEHLKMALEVRTRQRLRVDVLNELIDMEGNDKEMSDKDNPLTKKKLNEEESIETIIKREGLSSIFHSTSGYQKAMQCLVEGKFIEVATFLHCDTSKGSLSVFAALIKDLYFKGYLTKNPSSSDVQIICIHGFGITTISIDTIKKAKRENLPPFISQLIPVAT